MRERGLKLVSIAAHLAVAGVAPRAGATYVDLYYHGHNQNMPQQLEPAVLIYLLLSFKDVLRKIYNLFFRFVINIVLILIRFLFLDSLLSG